MILYFADRLMNIIGTASTNLPKSIVITNDAKTEDVDSGASAFECELSFDEHNRAKLEEITEVGNYLLRSDKGENEFYTIIDCEIDTKRQTAYIYAEDAGLDLLNDIIEPFEAGDSYEISYYVERTAKDAGWEIGVNELEGVSRKLKFADEQTGTARLLSIAKEFNDCEISFSFEVKGLQVTRKLINIYEQRGKDTDIQLRLNKQIDSIVTKKTINNLATALKAKGSSPADGENPVTLLNYSYDDGDFYVDGDVLKSREALKQWERYLWKGNDDEQTAGHIVKTFSYDTTSQAVLCEKAIEELKKIRDMEVNYEIEIVELPESARVGDRVNVIDEAGKLYLSTRLLKLVTSVTKQSYKATLGENFLKGSGIEAKVTDLAQQFAAIAKSRVFYTWIAYADDENGTNISTEPEGKAFIGIAANKTTEAVDISDPSVFTWSKIKGEDGKGGEYFHVRYSPYADGHDMTIEPDENTMYMGTCLTPEEEAPEEPELYQWVQIRGVDGKSVSTVENYYMVTDKNSGVTNEDLTQWKLNTIDELTEEKPYLWNFERTIYSDDNFTDSTPALIGNFAKDGEKGVGIQSIEEWYGLSNDENTLPAANAWSQDLPTMTPEMRFLWNYEVINYTKGDPVTTEPLIIGVYGEKGEQGEPGVSIDTVTEYYARSSSSTTAPGDSSFGTSVPTLTATYKYLWNYEVITYTGGKTATTTPKTVIGVFGADGKGISSITEYYLATSLSSGVTTSTSGWKTTPQTTTSTNKYLWNYEYIVYTDSSTHTTAPIVIGVHGEKGDKGDGIATVKNYYLASSSASGVTTSTSGWTEAVQTTTASKKYLWNYEEVSYTGSTLQPTKTDPCIIGVYSADGKGISSVTEYYLATSSSSGVTTSTSGWTTTIQTITATKKYLWNYEVIAYTVGNSTTTTPVIIGTYGEKGDTGKSISGVTNYYLASSSASGVTTSTSGWTEAVQTPTKDKKYLWNYEKVTYSEGSPTYTTPCIIGNFAEEGKEGVSISSVTEYYAKSSSSTSAPADSSFSTSVPTLDATNKYLWNYEKIEYTGGKTATYTPKCVIGVYGNKGDTGESISGVTNYYLATSLSSGVTTSTSGWTTTVQTMTATNKYLWNYEKITYTGSKSATITTPCIIGVFGADGKGISSVTEYYLATASSSGVTTSTSGWTTTIQTITATKKYLWNYEVISYTVGNSTTTTPAIIGVYGDKGDTGKDGQNLYAECQTDASEFNKDAILKTGSLSSISTGCTITVKFVKANTHKTPYLRVYNANSSSDITHYKSDGSAVSNCPIIWNKVSPSTNNPLYWGAGTVVTMVFDGVSWVIIDVGATKMDMTSSGLVVGNYSSSGTLANNVLIGPSDINIRNNTTVYASFGTTTTIGQTGSNNTNICIDSDSVDFRRGTSVIANMYYASDNIFGDTFTVKGPKLLELTSNDVIRMQSNYSYTSNGTACTANATLLLHSNGGHGVFDASVTTVKGGSPTMSAISAIPDKITLTSPLIVIEGEMEFDTVIPVSKGSTAADVRSFIYAMGCIKSGTYNGMALPDGGTNSWIRTPSPGLLPFSQDKTNGKSKIGTADWPFVEGHFKHVYCEETADSGWTTVSSLSNVQKYDNVDANIPKYRKIYKTVEVRGVVSPLQSGTGSATELTMFTLPTGYRPSTRLSFVCQGSGQSKWLLLINSDGKVGWTRYADGANYAGYTVSTWLPFNVQFFVD